MPTTLDPIPDVITDDNHIVPIVSYVRSGDAMLLQREISELVTRRTATRDDDIDLASWDSSSFATPGHSRSGPTDAWTMPKLGPGDLQGACWAVDNWSEIGRAFAGALLAAQRIRTFDLADKVGFDGHIPSVFRGIAGRLRALDRAPFWYGNPETKAHQRGQELHVTPGDAPYELMMTIFRARYPELL